MPPENELADVPVVDHISDSKALQLAAKTFINFGCLVIKSVFRKQFYREGLCGIHERTPRSFPGQGGLKQ